MTVPQPQPVPDSRDTDATHAVAVARAAVVAAFALCTFLTGPLAAQPLTNTLTEETRIANPVANSFGFGRALEIDGNTMVVGAPQGAGTGIQRGVVNIYVRGASGWVLQQTLTRSSGFGFGARVAVSGDTLVVSSEYSGGETVDRVPTVYVRANGVWTQQADLTHGDPSIGGERVAVAGDLAVIGTRGHGVYAFVRTGASWAQPQRLRAESSTSAPFALDGNAILIGEPSEAVAGQAGQGVAHLLVRDGEVWTEQAMLTLSGGRAGDAFGGGVDLHGDTALVIGGRRVWSFRRVSGQWIQETPFDLPQLPSSLGTVRPGIVTVHGDTAVVIHGTSTPYVVSYLYRRIGAGWYQVAPIHPASSSYTPADIEIGDDRVFVGFSQFGNPSPYPDTLTAFPGQVFVYRVPNGLPPAPPALTGSAASGSVSLSWTPGSGEAASSYVLEAGSSPQRSDVFNANIGPGLQLTATAPRGVYVHPRARRERHGPWRRLERSGARRWDHAASVRAFEPHRDRHGGDGDLQLEPTDVRRGHRLRALGGLDAQRQPAAGDGAGRVVNALCRDCRAAGHLLRLRAGT